MVMYALQFNFDCLKNEAKYGALLFGMQLAITMNILELNITATLC